MIQKLAAVAIAVGLALGGGRAQADRCFDFDGDGVVTVADVQIVVDHFGTFAQGPRYGYGIGYEGRFDLNHDQRIDLSDILLVIQQLDTEC